MMISDDICVKRIAILAFMSEQFGVTHWDTVRRWRRRGMPFHRMWNGWPFILKSEVIKWHLKNKNNVK